MRIRIATVVVAAAIAAWSGPHAQAQVHKNDEAGYHIKPPKHYAAKEGSFFSGLPVNENCLDFFERKVGLPSETLFTYDLYMATYYFPDRTTEPTETGGQKEKTGEEKSEDRVKSIGGERRTYRSFEEFATDKIRGFFFSDEDDTKMGGVPAKLYEMKFEKLTSQEQRWLACTYEAPGGEFAVLFNCTERHFKKMKREFISSFKSIKFVAEKNLKLTRKDKETSSGSTKVIDRREDDDPNLRDDPTLGAAERERRRIARRESRFAKAIEDLEKGWRHVRTDHYLILSECDAKYTKTIERHVEVLRGWLDETFAQVGEGTVEHAIINVFAKYPDSGGIAIIYGGGAIDELIFVRGRSWTGVEFEDLSDSIISHWFSQKNPELWSRMPRWLRYGLDEYICDAVVRGKKVTFPPDAWERRELAIGLSLQDRHRKERSTEPPPLLPVGDLFALSSEEQAKASTGRYVNAQNASLLRFLIEGPGKKWDRTETLLADYMQALLAEIEVVEARLKAEREAEARGTTRPQTEEELLAAEDEEYRKRRKETFDSIEKEIQQRVYERVFEQWSEDDWKDFDKKWLVFARKAVR